MIRYATLPAAVAALLVAGHPATAQTITVTPFVGYETAGSYPPQNPSDIQALRADAGRTYGVFFDYRLLQNVQAEFTWIHNATTYSASRDNPDIFVPAFDTSIDQYQIGGLFHLRDRDKAIRPYLAGGLGVTHDANGGGNPSRSAFSFSLGGGMTYEPTGHFGFRADARWIPTYGSSFPTSECDFDGFCYPATQRNFLQRINLTAGLIFRL